MKKSSKSSLKKRSLDIYLQHKKEASYKISKKKKKKLLHLAEKKAGAERINFDVHLGAQGAALKGAPLLRPCLPHR